MSGLLGSQVARFLVAPAPKGFVVDDADDAVAFAAGYGLQADPWQVTTLEAWLRRVNGLWAASTWAISVSRQNGKNGILEVVELYGMVALGLKFLHTAHEVKTARKAFSRIKFFFGEKANDPAAAFPRLNALVREVRNTNGQEAIVLRNGGSIEFIARSKGSGRGYTVDALVIDEAQELQDHELEALLPTTSAAPSGDPVTIYMGTPPSGASVLGDPFVRVREGALDGTNRHVAWVEHSADGYAEDMNDAELRRFIRVRRNQREGNPALGYRINQSTIESELGQFSPQSFARERLNMWPRPGRGATPIPAEKWDARAVSEVPDEWAVAAFGLDMNPERTRVTIAVALFAGESDLHVEIAEDSPFADAGTDALIEWVVKRARRRVPVVLDAFSPVRSIESALKQRGVKVFVLGSAELSQACGGLYDAVMKDESVTHFGQEPLNDSLAGATKDKFGHGGAWKWNRRGFDVDLTPLMSATCAHFGAVKFAKRGGLKKQKAVVL